MEQVSSTLHNGLPQRALALENTSRETLVRPPRGAIGLSLFPPHPAPLGFHNPPFLFTALQPGPGRRGDTLLIPACQFFP